MKIFKKVAMAILSVAFVLGFNSCREDSYVEIKAVTSCSPDLLQFVTPTVTITDDNGERQKFVLSPSDFSESDKGGSININIIINGDTTSIASTENYIANSTKRFDVDDNTVSVSGDIEVSYSLKEDLVLDKERYVFFHGVDCDTKIVEEGISMGIEGFYTKPVAYELTKEEVMDYLNELKTKSDTTPFKVDIN